jgi:hypothetical protein
MLISRHIMLVGLAVALGACAYANINGQVQFYDGDPRPDTATALLKGETLAQAAGSSHIRLVAINGRQLSGDSSTMAGATAASVLPGTYSVQLQYVPADTRQAPASSTVRVNVHAACEYQFVASYNPQHTALDFDVLPSAHGPVKAEVCARGLWPAPRGNR